MKMSKEYIQALDDLFGLVAFLPRGSFERAQKYFDVIELALQRLEQIDSANSNEAMKCFKHFKKWYDKIGYQVITSFQLDIDLSTIEQALIKAQEVEKENTEYRDFKTDVVKKALKGGIYAKDSLDENKLNYIPSVALSNVGDEWYLSNHCDFCVNVKDYKTLFWLKKDKSK